MASVPSHPFMKIIIEAVFSETNNDKAYSNKMMEVLETTGPIFLASLYEQYDNKKSIYIIPEELVTPLSKNEALMLIMNDKLEQKK